MGNKSILDSFLNNIIKVLCQKLTDEMVGASCMCEMEIYYKNFNMIFFIHLRELLLTNN